jgi:hypothetical protein
MIRLKGNVKIYKIVYCNLIILIILILLLNIIKSNYILYIVKKLISKNNKIH